MTHQDLRAPLLRLNLTIEHKFPKNRKTLDRGQNRRIMPSSSECPACRPQYQDKLCRDQQGRVANLRALCYP